MTRLKEPHKQQPDKPEATDERVKAGLCHLGKTADGLKQSYLKLQVHGTAMQTAELLAKYTNLQSVDLRHNMLTDLSHLSRLPRLTHLDASYNNLTEVVALDPPTLNLRSLNLSYNSISSMRDISMYRQLAHLVLDGNRLTRLNGLNGLPFLKVLSAQHNHLTTCQGLEECVGLLELHLSFNSIETLAPLQSLSNLEILQVMNNKLPGLLGLQGLTSLQKLDCSNNAILEMEEVRYANPLPLLKNLQITGNAISSYRLSRLHLLYLIPQLEVLNGEEVSPSENVNAANLHGADAEQLRQIRKRHFPDGELDDGGGAVVPVSAGLLAASGLDAKDDEVDFGAADAAAKEVAIDLVLQGLDKFGDHLIRKLPSQLALTRACWSWVVQYAAPLPSYSWDVNVPALRPEAAEVEKMLIPNAHDGTYAEKLAYIFVTLCRACQLEANEVLGFWKHDSLRPGVSMTSHNHCWSVVKVNGRWRLLDVFWAVKATQDRYSIPFYISPEAFVYSHLPLEEWWQLLGTYVTPQQFWEMPFCSLFFFAKGFFFTDDSLGAVNVAGMATDESSATEFSGVPVAEIVLEHPREPVTHELLDCDMNPVQPDRQPGSFVFTQVNNLSAGGRVPGRVQELRGKGMVEQSLWACFPKPGEYYIRVNLVGGPVLMIIKYIVPKEMKGKAVVFPSTSPDFIARGCQLISPPIGTLLRGDITYDWEVYAPGASKVVVAGNNCTAEDSRPAQEMRLVSPAYFAVEAKMPRVPQIHVFAYFQDMQAVPALLLSYVVLPPVHDLVPIKPDLHQRAQPCQLQGRAQDLFRRLDIDGDGMVSRSELAAGLRSISSLPGLLGFCADLSRGTATADFHKLFAMLDNDGIGRISLAGFTRRLQRVADEMPRVVVEMRVGSGGKVGVNISEEVPHVSAG